MSKASPTKLKAGDSARSTPPPQPEIDRINREENLVGDGNFRLAAIHRDLRLANQTTGNVVLANLRVKFITRSEVEVEHVIPVMVTQGESREALTCYSGKQIEEVEFLKFYQSARPEISVIERKHHYHSEPFLAYYLSSQDGKNFLATELLKKGLTALDEKKNLRSDVKEITAIGIDLHSTKVICFNCGPFLSAAIPQILQSVYEAAALSDLPPESRLQKIEFNVSANQNFDQRSVSASTFDHIPVNEKPDEKNVLTNTEEMLGARKAALQKVGEASNRTYFLSGSGFVSDEVLRLRAVDQQEWRQVSNAAATKIQKAWRGFSVMKKIEEEVVKRDAVNYVSDNFELTYRNIDFLSRASFAKNGVREKDYDETVSIVAVRQSDSANVSLHSALRKFIAGKRDHESILMCHGEINPITGEIEGAAHWTALHLRKFAKEGGGYLVKTFHMNSDDGIIPVAVGKVLLASQNAPNIEFAPCRELICLRQNDRAWHQLVQIPPLHYDDNNSSGYHAVFNALRMHNNMGEFGAVSETMSYNIPYCVMQNNQWMGFDQFITQGRQDLQWHFNKRIDAVNDRKSGHDVEAMDKNFTLMHDKVLAVVTKNDSNFDKLHQLITAEQEVRDSRNASQIKVLKDLPLDKLYQKIIVAGAVNLRQKFYSARHERYCNSEALEKFLEKLTSPEQCNKPREVFEIARAVEDDILAFGRRVNIVTSVAELRLREMSLKDFVVRPNPSPQEFLSEQVRAMRVGR